MVRDNGGGRPAVAQRSSMADVAALAGVSKGTVSHVLNHPERVSPATRERVEAAIEKLRFVPHGTARSLAIGSMPALGVVLSDISNSLFVDLLEGVERAAQERGAYVLIANSYTDLRRERRYMEMFESVRTLGNLVTINSQHHYANLVRDRDRDGHQPLVFLNYRGEDDRFCFVHADNRAGGAMVARHLVETGRRNIAVVTTPWHLQPIEERLAGFEEAIAGTGARIVSRESCEQIHRADGWRVGRALLPRIRSGEVDAVFAVADLVAAGIAQALADDPGIRIPEDVAIVGYDDNQAAWDSPLPITTVRQPGEGMGATGVQLVYEELNDPTHEHRVVRLGPELVVRASSVPRAAS
ncbi:LacI family DNA-binding transcriptional regulator [Demequina rhizosphaerae]|uniref:LacI family DNA-binding transcriptional regulator n=1 Tax=Demequina rhizosphaerae TaxID=1638985 RepID=UPI0009E22290|nr:LacI family DNA-binding transcriptional regulator [Demequina rhizosphaerae]